MMDQITTNDKEWVIDSYDRICERTEQRMRASNPDVLKS